MSNNKPPMATVELEDRDPNNLSGHLQVDWEDVIGEPESVRSPECAWMVSNQCFRITKNCCYIGLSVLCAPVTAFVLGIAFACLSFQHIWCISPSLRMWRINCAATKNFVVACTDAILIPCTGACGYIFSQIKVRTHRILDSSGKQESIVVI